LTDFPEANVRTRKDFLRVYCSNDPKDCRTLSRNWRCWRFQFYCETDFILRGNKLQFCESLLKIINDKSVNIKDLDGTLVDKDSTANLAAWIDYWNRCGVAFFFSLPLQNVHLFFCSVAPFPREEVPKGSMLCFNTARCIKDYEKLVKNCAKSGVPLPKPHVLITGEGTEIRWCRDHVEAHGFCGPTSNRSIIGRIGASDDFVVDKVWERLMDHEWRVTGIGSKVASLLGTHDEKLAVGLNDVGNSPPLGECRCERTSVLFTAVISDTFLHVEQVCDFNQAWNCGGTHLLRGFKLSLGTVSECTA
jgi:hypothetical protein